MTQMVQREQPGSAAPVARHHTACAACGRSWDAGYVPVCDACGGLVEVTYDLATVRVRVEAEGTFARYRELLPVADEALLPTDLPVTPAVHATRLGAILGLSRLYLKDETVLPSGTTKDRMAAVALPYLSESGVTSFCASSTGNSSTSLSRIIDRFPGLRMSLFTASAFARRVWTYDSDRVTHFVLEQATFDDAGREAEAYARRTGAVLERGFFNPARREGLKTVFFEATEQIPQPIDWYVQAVSSAMGVHGVAKGARELLALGRIDRIPRLLCVQQETCAPMVAAWLEGSDVIRPHHIVHDPRGIAEAILRGDPSRAYPHVRRIVAESGGTFTAVSEQEIRTAREMVLACEGIDCCPAAAAAVAGAARMARSGHVRQDETVLINLTGVERADRPLAPTSRVLHRATPGGWAGYA